MTPERLQQIKKQYRQARHLHVGPWPEGDMVLELIEAVDVEKDPDEKLKERIKELEVENSGFCNLAERNIEERTTAEMRIKELEAELAVLKSQPRTFSEADVEKVAKWLQAWENLSDTNKGYMESARSLLSDLGTVREGEVWYVGLWKNDLGDWVSSNPRQTTEELRTYIDHTFSPGKKYVPVQIYIPVINPLDKSERDIATEAIQHLISKHGMTVTTEDKGRLEVALKFLEALAKV